MYGYIYMTTNKLDGKKYIGKKKSEIFLGDKYLGSGVHLECAIKKYGKENFSVDFIQGAYSLEELNSLERQYIQKYGASESDDFYNIASGGDGGVVWGKPENHPSLGKHGLEGERNPAYGKKWYHNNEGEMILIGESDCIPEGFVRGTGRYPCEGRTMLISPLGERKYVRNDCVEQFRLEGWKTIAEMKKLKSSRKQTPDNEMCKKIRHKRTDKYRIYNNGLNEIRVYENDSPQDGYVLGRLPRKSGQEKTKSKKKVDSGCNAGNAISKIDKYKNTMKNKTQEEKELIRLHRSESHKGKKHTEEHKNRIGQGVRKFYADHPEKLKPPKTKGKFHLTDEQKQKVSISMVGRKHITNGIQNKFVFSQDVDEYLSLGWKLGQTSKDKMQENQINIQE